MGYAQIANRVWWLWDETIFEDYFLPYIYLYAIRVEGHVPSYTKGIYILDIYKGLCVCRGLCKPPSRNN